MNTFAKLIELENLLTSTSDGGQPLFDRVARIGDGRGGSLPELLSEHLIFEERFCLVSLERDDLRSRRRGRTIRALRTMTIVLLIGDHWTTGTARGIEDGGVLDLKDNDVEALQGRRLTSGEQIAFGVGSLERVSRSESPGRVLWIQELRLEGDVVPPATT
jgi:hypothetical protein